jgi:hypothetical protein
VSSTILYRAIDANSDPLWGNGIGNFLADIYATAQAIQTRLRLNVGEMWLALQNGLPTFQAASGTPSTEYILGSPNGAAIAESLISATITGTPYVNSISNVETAFDRKTRLFVFAAIAQTQFGPITVVYSPGLQASLTYPNQSLNVLNTMDGFGAGSFGGPSPSFGG